MKRLAFCIAALSLATSACAQGVPPPPQSKTYTLSVSTEEMNVILEALAAQPWRTSNPVIQKLFAQVKQQDEPSPPPSGAKP